MAGKVKQLVKPIPLRCPCVASNRFTCMAARHSTPDFPVSTDLTRILGGCTCTCHRTANGAEIANEAWTQLRNETQS